MGSKPNINHWLTPDDDPLKEVLLKRYTEACRWVYGTVYDLACGWGFGTSMLAREKGVTVAYGMDVDENALKFAQSMAVPHAFFLLRNLDECEIPNTCDWVVTCETVEHLKDPVAFIEKVKAAVRIGVVLTTPIVPTVGKNPHHLHDFTPEQIDGWFGGWNKVQDMRLSERVGREYRELYKLAVYKK